MKLGVFESLDYYIAWRQNLKENDIYFYLLSWRARTTWLRAASENATAGGQRGQSARNCAG
jgi:hypothetical protein